jgi:2-hydroxy-6-oxonona-2,4-dienedioate hydrolase
MSITRRFLIAGGAFASAAALFGSGYATGAFREAVAVSRKRVATPGTIVQTRFGQMEYVLAGQGRPLMMIHGTGGGFDQGLLFSGGLIDRGFEVVSPSRFGYLRSDFPENPSPENQADALAELLDHLQIEKLPVAGGSAGALTAAWFAKRHPDRCSHLILLVPAANLSNRDPVEFTAPQRFAVGRLLTSDFWFWVALKLAPNQLIGTLLATDPVLLQAVSAGERARAELILKGLMPISARTRGMMNDGHYAGSPTSLDFASITMPALIVSAEDDRFGTAETARTIAALIPAAELVIYETGGHIWLGHDDDLSDRIAAFVGD